MVILQKISNLNNGVQEGHGVQEHRPAGVIGVIEGVLRDIRVRPLQAGPNTLGWFIREFKRHLKSWTSLDISDAIIFNAIKMSGKNVLQIYFNTFHNSWLTVTDQ
jgi:hypothetical protein